MLFPTTVCLSPLQELILKFLALFSASSINSYECDKSPYGFISKYEGRYTDRQTGIWTD
jgi:hypothetical protein